ncbi:MAG: 23S rRNA (pseudouridine(1915)-N(3))-methyltransferase RlmH [Mucinivorans sp.]
MKVELVVVGRTADKWLREGRDEYLARLTHYTSLAMSEVEDLARVKIEPSDYVVLLDERGVQRTSEDMATWIEKIQNRSPRRLIFMIGGAFGFSAELYARADEMISLSKMTFSHQMVRVIFLEQLYRAHTILKGEKYHHA